LDKLLFDSNKKLSTEQKIRLIRGIALGMQHLHKNNIIHRDLAARNILLSGSGDPKISVCPHVVFLWPHLIRFDGSRNFPKMNF